MHSERMPQFTCCRMPCILGFDGGLGKGSRNAGGSFLCESKGLHQNLSFLSVFFVTF